MWPFSKKLEPAKVFAGNYDLAFTYIPSLIEGYEKGTCSLEKLYDVKSWKKELKDNEMCQYDWKNTGASIKTAADKLKFITYGFSKVGMAPTCPVVGVVVIDKVKNTNHYYTLEESFGSYAICSNNHGVHANYGSIPHDGEAMNTFIHKVINMEGLSQFFKK